MFLRQTCAKAGLPTEAWKSEDTDIFIFSAQVFAEADLCTIPQSSTSA
jgi:hypothetical protein